MDIVEIYTMIRWILCAAAAALLSGLAPVFMRAGARRSDPSLAAALFSTVLMMIVCIPPFLGGEWPALALLSGRRLLFLALSGLLTALCCLCLFTALTGASVGRVFPLINLSGVLMTVLAYFFLGGGLGIWRLCCLGLILLGTVLLESRSQRSGSLRWLLYAVLGLFSLTAVSFQWSFALEGGLSETLALPVQIGIACVLLWIFVLARGRQRSMRAMGFRGWSEVVLAAVCIGLASVLDWYGARFGDLSWLAPISCLGFASMLLFARIFLKEKLPGSAVFGLLLVLAGTFAMLMGW